MEAFNINSNTHGLNPALPTPTPTVFLDLYELSSPEQQFKGALEEKMIGQEQLKEGLMECYRAGQNPLRDPNRPIFTLMVMGPTGVGKTLGPQILSEELHGDRSANIRINCSAYKHSSDLTRLFGAGPKWVGYRDPNTKIPAGQLDTSARLSGHNLIASRKGSKTPITVVILDEFEKGCEELQQAFLAIFDNGKEAMANNSEVDFTQCIFVITSNLGMAEAEQNISKRSLGLRQQEVKAEDTVESIVEKRYIEAYSPEFRNRIDMKVTCRALTPAEVRKVTDVEIKLILDGLTKRLGLKTFSVCIETPARDFITALALKEGGARSVKRMLNRHVSRTIGTGIINKQLAPGHTLTIKYEEGRDRLSFERSGEAIVLPPVPIPLVTPTLKPSIILPGPVDLKKTAEIAESDRLRLGANKMFLEQKFDEIMPELNLALTLLESYKDTEQLRRADLMHDMALLHVVLGKHSKAASYFRSAIHARESGTTADNLNTTPHLPWMYHNLAHCYLLMGNRDETEATLNKGLETIKRWPSKDGANFMAITVYVGTYKTFNPARSQELDELLEAIKNSK